MWFQNWQRGGNSWHYVVFIPEIPRTDFEISLHGFTSLQRSSPDPRFFPFPIPMEGSKVEEKQQPRT